MLKAPQLALDHGSDRSTKQEFSLCSPHIACWHTNLGEACGLGDAGPEASDYVPVAFVAEQALHRRHLGVSVGRRVRGAGPAFRTFIAYLGRDAIEERPAVKPVQA
jgi:hypothetical protein